MTELLTVPQLVVATIVMAAGAALQGAVGFGAALVAAPLLVLVDPGLVPGPITIAGIALGVLAVRRERSHVDLPSLRWSLAGLLPGTLLAGWALRIVSDRALAVGVGVLVLVAVGLSATGLSVARRPRTLALAGAVSGFMGTAAAVSGPPMAIVYQHVSGPELRATLARFFIGSAVVSVPTLVVAGRLGPAELVAGLALVPGVVLGHRASGLLVHRVDRGRTRLVVLVTSAASAAFVIVRQLAL